MKKLISFIIIAVLTLMAVVLTFSVMDDIAANFGLFLLTKLSAFALFYFDYKLVLKAFPEINKEEV